MSGSTISRRDLLRATGISVAGVAGCSAPGTDPGNGDVLVDDFEDGFTGWDSGSDVPEDPNNPGNLVEWSITRSTVRAASGAASLRYYLDGRQDDGTIWIVRPVRLESGESYEVSMEVQAWSASESFNTLAYLVMYAGRDRPTSEGSFPEPGANSTGGGVTRTGGLRETLNQTEGWMPYSFTWETPPLDSDLIHIAAGISAVWETEMTYFIDDVVVEAKPRAG